MKIVQIASCLTAHRSPYFKFHDKKKSRGIMRREQRVHV